jgi:membrane associated rhomboid family serine protease
VSPPPSRSARAVNIPPVVGILIGINLLVHLLRGLLGVTQDWAMVRTFGLISTRYTTGADTGAFDLLPLLTHMFLHGDAMHLLMNMLVLLAFGSGLERRLGGMRFLAFYLICGLVGAAAHLLVFPYSGVPVIGASGAISGLFGGLVFMLVVAPNPRAARLGPISGLRPAITLAVFWILVQIVFGLGAPFGEAAVAWWVHIGGFVGGFLLFGPFDRLGRRRPPAPPD